MQQKQPSYNMRELQLHILDILLAFDKVCKEHNLHYYLVFGTMLGAVRHKGFIPWDDDIDVAIPRPEYEILIEHADEWLPKPYEFVCHETDSKFMFGFGKIQDASTTLIERKHIDYLGGVYIDIFPIDGISSNKLLQRIQYWRYSFCKKIGYLLQRDPYKHGHGASSWLPLLVHHIFSKDGIMRRFKRVMLTYDYGKSTYTSLLNDGMTSVMPKRYYGTPTPVEFEGHRLMGVECPHEYLKHEFGDYMKVPDEAHRVSHNFYYLDLHSPYRDYNDTREFVS